MDVILAGVVGFFLWLAMVVVFAVPASWVVMLILGALHATYPAVPAIGFWLTLVSVVGVRLVLGQASSNSSD